MGILKQPRIASAPVRRQAFARYARRLAPRLTATRAPAQKVISSCFDATASLINHGPNTKFLTTPVFPTGGHSANLHRPRQMDSPPPPGAALKAVETWPSGLC